MPPSAHHLRTGAAGEALAKEYLSRLGWTILATNERVGKKEFDIIALEGEVTVFVEVKARRGHQFGRPEESVTEKKLALLHAGIGLYLRGHPRIRHVRLDVIAIEYFDTDRKPTLKHLRGIDSGTPLAFLP